MLKLVFGLIVLSREQEQKKCCHDHNNKENNIDINAINYNCSQLTPFGKERCNSVYNGNICSWGKNPICNPSFFKKCVRVNKYESHFGEVINVGRCKGGCKNNASCEVSEYSPIQMSDTIVNVVKECDCVDCHVEDRSYNLELQLGRCDGKCNEQQSKTCTAGVNDGFDLSNGPEPSNPSPLLLSNILSTCSNGVQPGFDTFIDNRCFGHTFTNCFDKGSCPLRTAHLHMCVEAANVPLTFTDSVILGINGGGLWSISLPDLNGGTWNPGEQLCFTLDLDNLPNGGLSILNDISSIGHLDVVVQDDTAVDFLTLRISYENCEVCLPTLSNYLTFHNGNTLRRYLDVEKCDCVDTSSCVRVPNQVTYFRGTKFEKTVDVGRCVGKCNSNFLRCQAKDYQPVLMDSPYFEDIKVNIINSCDCLKTQWNNLGLIKL